MKIIFSLFIMLLFSAALSAQTGDITFILLRHAERDNSPTANLADRDLTDAGRQRSLRFFETAKPYKPEQIFSTIYRRARETVAPLAQNLNADRRIQIQIYDFSKIEEFVERLLKLDAKTVVVAGHSNTTPMLANLLIRENKYKDMSENEYDKIWIIKIKRKKGKFEKIVAEEVINY